MPPTHPGPPLPVTLPFRKIDAPRARSLYGDLFGTDLTVVMEALHDGWANEEQQLLSEQLASGEKDMGSLSQLDRDLLDSIARNYAALGGSREAVCATDGERLRLSTEKSGGREGKEGLQSRDSSLLQSGLSASAGTYGWLDEEDDE